MCKHVSFYDTHKLLHAQEKDSKSTMDIMTLSIAFFLTCFLLQCVQ